MLYQRYDKRKDRNEARNIKFNDIFGELSQDQRTALYWQHLFNKVSKAWNMATGFIDKEVYQTTLLKLTEDVFPIILNI